MKINPNSRVFLLIMALVGCSVLWLLGGLPKLGLNILSATKKGASTSQNQLRILHYNIWFGKFKMVERMRGIAKIIDELRPNIIALNEVTKENLAMLKREDGLKRYKVVPADDIYKTMPADLPKIHLHTTVVLTDLPVVSWKAFRFENSKEGRRLVIAELHIPIYEKIITLNKAKRRNVSFVAAVSHLEWNRASTMLREEQLKKSISSISSFENACFTADMNNRENIDGDLILRRPWHDLWMTIPGNTHQNGYTWDPTKNSMVKSKTKARFDRVICKLADLKVQSIELVGNKELSPGVFPSDHFGLFAVLVPKVHESEEIKGEGQPSFKRPAGYEKNI